MEKFKNVLVSIFMHIVFILLFSILMKFSFDFIGNTFSYTVSKFSWYDWTDPYKGETSMERIGIIVIIIELVIVLLLSATMAKYIKAKYSLYITLILAHLEGIYLMVVTIQAFDGFIALTLYCITIYITVIALILGNLLGNENK